MSNFHLKRVIDVKTRSVSISGCVNSGCGMCSVSIGGFLMYRCGMYDVLLDVQCIDVQYINDQLI